MTHKTFEEPSLFRHCLYHFSKRLIRLYFQTFWRLEATGIEKIPPGGVLLAANHQSLADPPLIGCVLKRAIYYFAKEELFHYPILGWWIKKCNAFPVRRFDHDVGAFKHAQHLLQNGQIVLVFPEGRRSRTGEIGKAKPGVGMLAYKAQVPVVPVCVVNSNKMSSFAKIRIAFLDPIYPEPTKDEKHHYQEFSDRVLAKVADSKTKML